ncbi:MAG: glycoside hydrolase family 9 protein [Bacteroidales bacterium]|nr:glycoside hydrolase family 9 protein [Bacteroidales bacterium]
MQQLRAPVLYRRFLKICILLVIIVNPGFSQQQSLKINDLGYFEMPGLNVTAFSDFYPDGHQSGVTIIQHGVRVAANGDLRLETSPGQWSAIPKNGTRIIDTLNQTITQKLWFPDSSRNAKGFNPIYYPDFTFKYQVNVNVLSNNTFRVTVDLEKPLPEEWVGQVGFNFELFPGDLFGKAFLMDNQSGIFPAFPYGPLKEYYDNVLAEPLAEGKRLVVAPESDMQKITIESRSGQLELWDGRTNHNNGWYILRSLIPANTTKSAIEWVITPNVVPDWKYIPIVHISQLGYKNNQQKIAIIEQDKSDFNADQVTLLRLTPEGKKAVKTSKPEYWGKFLRYNYLTFDFSEIKEPGMYQISYRKQTSAVFKVSDDVYDRNAWQPTLEYFLPVQMCHMRINEKYRVWHDRCHLDDALMAPVDSTFFDGYMQGPSTLTDYKPFEHVPELNAGGWHDAGDYDLRVESQIGTVWKLAMMIEEFGLDYDATLIDQEKKLVEIHVPDGKSDAIQQVEHGLLTVLGAYRSMGRLYRGIICPTLRQYVMLGDASSMTDDLIFDPSLTEDEVKDGHSGIQDDRLVFTEVNPDRELYTAAGLAAASRVLKDSNPELSEECLTTSLALYYSAEKNVRRTSRKVMALTELILTTDDSKLKETLVSMKDSIIKDIDHSGWILGRVIHKIDNKKFKKDIAFAVAAYQASLNEIAKESPFGVPYRPNIWGAGWIIQEFGLEQYFFYKGWPESTNPEFFVNALNFVLGVHPGENSASFASGVGSESVKVAYGVNRADWSFIPGGVVSGTALIRPDLPELKIWPFFWQQTEYVLGGGATNYMFLVLAVDNWIKQ